MFRAKCLASNEHLEASMNLIRKFLCDVSGASSIEYAMLASCVAAVIIAAVNSLGAQVKETYETVDEALK